MALFKEGDFIRIITSGTGRPLSERTKRDVKVITELDRLFPQLTDAEVDELHHRMLMEELNKRDLSPERRRELLKQFERCPCCDSWLGHNNPPAGDAVIDDPPPRYRRQTSFKF
jgi:hypothetical protein